MLTDYEKEAFSLDKQASTDADLAKRSLAEACGSHMH